MHRRPLGRSGVAVSEIGYGAWGIGGTLWIGARDDESLRALHRAVDLGVDFVDTALGYGAGHSEQLVGRVVRGPSAQVRQTSRSFVWACAANAEGQSAEARLEAPEAYQLTAYAAVRAVERLLAGNVVGALTPAQAFGADFVLELPRTTRS